MTDTDSTRSPDLQDVWDADFGFLFGRTYERVSERLEPISRMVREALNAEAIEELVRKATAIREQYGPMSNAV